MEHAHRSTRDQQPCSSQTYSSTNVSTLASPRYDEDGCWSRVDRRACSILLLVLLLVLTYTIGLKEHDDALEQARTNPS